MRRSGVDHNQPRDRPDRWLGIQPAKMPIQEGQIDRGELVGSNPINLAVRFVLELTALAGLGRWGWTVADGIWRIVLSVGVVVVAAAVWGTFNVPGDPSRSGKAPVVVPGWLRLLLETAFFGLASWAWFVVGPQTLATLFLAAVIVHYAASYDRIGWLLNTANR